MAEPIGRGQGIDWIASYPKSGNTWMRMLLANYFLETDEPHDINAPGVTRGIAGSRWLIDSYAGIASSDLLPAEARALRPGIYDSIARRNAERLWMKAHDRQERIGDAWLFPPQVTGVAVYIVRNPLDVAVSNAFHDGHGDMQRAVDKLCDTTMAIGHRSGPQTEQRLGDWSSHVLSWIDQPDMRVLVVRYEDMLADAGAVLSRVVGFARPERDADPARIEQAVRHSRLDILQSAERARGFRETPANSGAFFRAGRKNDWRHHLTPAQVAQIRARHLSVMTRLGYAKAGIPGEDD